MKFFEDISVSLPCYNWSFYVSRYRHSTSMTFYFNFLQFLDDISKLAMSLLEVIPERLLSHESLQAFLTPAMKCQSGYFSPGTGAPWEVDYQHNHVVSLILMQKYSNILALCYFYVDYSQGWRHRWIFIQFGHGA